MIGGKLGPYSIEETLGKGGMGTVYRARDTRLERPVAIKVLNGGPERDARAEERLLEEARAASALNHPNICTIHEVGEDGGRAYIVMELVEGPTLRDVVPVGGLPPETAIHYALQIAGALAHAHERGIVHRDLKSTNVAVTAEGRVKVLDFGLALRVPVPGAAKPSESTTPATDTGGGTLSFMSPESLRGEAGDERSDIWSLGVVLHEMLAGALPFAGRTAYETASAILREAPAPLPRRVPTGLRSIVSRSLMKDPARRYQKAGEVRAALEAVSAAVHAEQAPREPRSRRAADSVAVLPFVNASGDPDSEYLGDGLTETLISSLSQLRRLRVMARSTVFGYKRRGIGALEAGRELGVKAVLAGTVRLRGDHVHVAAELVDVEHGWQLWGAQYDRRVSDLSALQQEIAEEMFDKLRLRLTGAEKKRIAQRAPGRPEAYQAYLRGRFEWNKRTEQSLKKGIEHFEQAIAIDPEYALAYAGLADSYDLLGEMGAEGVDPRESFARGRQAAERALAIDPALAEARTSLAQLNRLEWNWRETESGFRKAIELNPSYATAHHWYAFYLIGMDRTEEAIAEIRKALELEPLSLIFNADMADILYLARRFEEARAQAERALAFDPNFAPALRYLAAADEALGRYDEAIDAFQRVRRIAGRPASTIEALGDAYRTAGMPGYWRKELETLRSGADRRPVLAYRMATIHARLGETEEAFGWLENACTERAPGTMILLGVDPRLDKIRSDPRFPELLRRVGLRS